MLQQDPLTIDIQVKNFQQQQNPLKVTHLSRQSMVSFFDVFQHLTHQYSSDIICVRLG